MKLNSILKNIKFLLVASLTGFLYGCFDFSENSEKAKDVRYYMENMKETKFLYSICQKNNDFSGECSIVRAVIKGEVDGIVKTKRKNYSIMMLEDVQGLKKGCSDTVYNESSDSECLLLDESIKNKLDFIKEKYNKMPYDLMLLDKDVKECALLIDEGLIVEEGDKCSIISDIITRKQLNRDSKNQLIFERKVALLSGSSLAVYLEELEKNSCNPIIKEILDETLIVKEEDFIFDADTGVFIPSVFQPSRHDYFLNQERLTCDALESIFYSYFTKMILQKMDAFESALESQARFGFKAIRQKSQSCKLIDFNNLKRRSRQDVQYQVSPTCYAYETILSEKSPKEIERMKQRYERDVSLYQSFSHKKRMGLFEKKCTGNKTSVLALYLSEPTGSNYIKTVDTDYGCAVAKDALISVYRGELFKSRNRTYALKNANECVVKSKRGFITDIRRKKFKPNNLKYRKHLDDVISYLPKCRASEMSLNLSSRWSDYARYDCLSKLVERGEARKANLACSVVTIN